MTSVEADVVKDLYRRSKVEVWSDVQGSSKDLTASRMSRDRFLQGSSLKCSSSPGTCIPCKLGSRPVLMHRSCKAQRNPHARARNLWKKGDFLG